MKTLTLRVNDKYGNCLTGDSLYTYDLYVLNSNMSKAVKIIVGVLIVIGVIVGLVFWLTSGLPEVAEKQLAALRSGDIEKAYSYTSKDFQHATSLEDFRKFVDQYPSLKNNKSDIFTSRAIENNIGTLRGSLQAQDGAVTPIEYKLVNENNEWKILSLQVLPSGANVQGDATQEDLTLSKTYTNTTARYSVKYPTSWQAVPKNETTVLISGMEGRESFYSTVNIQALPTKESGGVYENAEALLEDLKSQLKNDTSSNITGEMSFDYALGDKTVKGYKFIAEYDFEEDKFKQLQTVIPSSDGNYIFALAFTAPPDLYDRYKSVAESIMSTWQPQ